MFWKKEKWLLKILLVTGELLILRNAADWHYIMIDCLWGLRDKDIEMTQINRLPHPLLAVSQGPLLCNVPNSFGDFSFTSQLSVILSILNNSKYIFHYSICSVSVFRHLRTFCIIFMNRCHGHTLDTLLSSTEIEPSSLLHTLLKQRKIKENFSCSCCLFYPCKNCLSPVLPSWLTFLLNFGNSLFLLRLFLFGDIRSSNAGRWSCHIIPVAWL